MGLVLVLQSSSAALGIGVVPLTPSPQREKIAADAVSRLGMVEIACALGVCAVPLNGWWDGQRARNEADLFIHDIIHFDIEIFFLNCERSSVDIWHAIIKIYLSVFVFKMFDFFFLV